ncbi:MAG: T9SS type A sorting domain-containing protein, partial [Candidatus Cloacimonetes bacterium]|nr:T9SS type A sorting domain-containing protein [Candidatus Cloacimonadota bacterium]
TSFSTDDFDLTIAANTLGGSEIRLDIEIEDSSGNIWNDYIFLTVQGANLATLNYTVEDANGFLDPGETADLTVTLQNNGMVTAGSIYGELFSSDSRLSVTDGNGYFGSITGEGGQSTNTSDPFELTAGAQLIVGTQVMMELQLYNADGYDSTVFFLIEIGEVSIHDPVGPDAYGYFCYDDGDTDYLSAPSYDWIEINAIGTNLNLSDPGNTGDIESINDLPITFKMYGEEYTSLTVCSNGWIAPGGSSQASFMNSPIPGPQGPSPMIAPFWDDLNSISGGVYWYYDSSLHTMIIEWDHMQNDVNSEETFQVILYDADYYPTMAGDSEIKYQYKVINNNNPGSYPSQHGQYASVGIEDQSGTIGLEYTFNNAYPTAAKHLQNEMALLVTGSPIPLEIPFLVLGGVTIIDADGNGQADYGENVFLDILLNNLGENPATNVSSTISSTDPYIILNQTESSYNNIQGGGSASSLTDFEFTVDESCPDGHVVSFEMNVNSNEENWTLHFNVTLNAPDIEFQSVFIDDDENNILDPGETADIYVSFINNGGSNAYNVVTEISESDPYITLNSTSFTFTAISSGNVSTGLYNVTASETAPVGHLADVNWEMNGDNNFTNTGIFNLVISQVPVLLEEDFSGTYPPDGWTLSGLNTGNWSQSTTNNAGGSAPESKLNWSPSFTGTSRLVSPILNTAGSTTLDFQFNHYLNNFAANSYTLNVRTTSDGGATWNSAWEVIPTGDLGPELIELSVATPDVGSQEFQIAFVFEGYSYNINYWYIDDIHLEGGQGTSVGFIEGNISLDGGAGNVENVTISAGGYAASPNASGDYFIPVPAGTYDVVASLPGYELVTENGVVILPNETEVIDFTLSYLQAPENLTASVVSNDVSLEWDITSFRSNTSRRVETVKISGLNKKGNTSSESEEISTLRSLTGFKVYRNNIEITQISNPGQTNYDDNGLDSGDYTYYVTATYDDDNESLGSNTVQLTIVLAAPLNLVAESQAPNILLNWESPEALRSLTGFRVYRDGVSIAVVSNTAYIDNGLSSGIYTYFVTALYGQYESAASNEETIEHTETDDPVLPSITALMGNYPNPFNPETTIKYSLNAQEYVQIVIYNIKGEIVKKLVDCEMAPGFQSAVWNGQDGKGQSVASGIYFYRFRTDNKSQTKKMMLIK